MSYEKKTLTDEINCYVDSSGDIFHALHPFGKLCQYKNNRVLDALKSVEVYKHKINCPRGKWKTDENRQEALRKLIVAEDVYAQKQQCFWMT